jgi:hypothetical protein
MQCEVLLLFSKHYMREIPNLQELCIIYPFLSMPKLNEGSTADRTRLKLGATSLLSIGTYGPFSQWQSRHSNSPNLVLRLHIEKAMKCRSTHSKILRYLDQVFFQQMCWCFSSNSSTYFLIFQQTQLQSHLVTPW